MKRFWRCIRKMALSECVLRSLCAFSLQYVLFLYCMLFYIVASLFRVKTTPSTTSSSSLSRKRRMSMKLSNPRKNYQRWPFSVTSCVLSIAGPPILWSRLELLWMINPNLTLFMLFMINSSRNVNDNRLKSKPQFNVIVVTFILLTFIFTLMIFVVLYFLLLLILE